ncbi:glycine--tRNA ligase [Candidatus Wolfebacteria bacterium RBG_13_41_7]|uniref:Glycine--tRNA ligase n=1 Tax=Candidatus Wolfebacteria bacterium RBG_13_41_7 TaxID=1802554 RepID=A0A1F8DPB4_9BACT|nr:MAG: glycine--tRNA ligase [Candidatus Wolfebacteria bacterium RBG_13_41_7]
MADNLMEKIVSLCKRRGFIFPGSEIYGGLANSWDYGPLGVELKNNIAQLWWKRFVQNRDDMIGIDAALIMNSKVWEASGHLREFSDPLVECKNCHERFRADQIDKICPNCGGKEFTQSRQFNILMKTFLGPVEGEKAIAYLRGEIAQAMFVNFKNVLDTNRKKLPFGIASQGKSFRNEITPGNFIFRTREFNLMEFEYFVEEKKWEEWFKYWQKEMKEWLKDLGVNLKKIHEVEIPEDERAHYSKKTVDFEYEYPFGQKELYGLAYRTDFDLKNHEKFSGQNLKYRDAETGKEFWPHVIEPTFGLDRSVLVTLLEAYYEDEDRIVLKLPAKLAPYKAAVSPLLANKPELVEKAKEIYDNLRKDFMVAWDDRGNIGKRYYSQDEIGTPFCITVDFDSLKDDSVTIRARDTAKQERIKIKDLASRLK